MPSALPLTPQERLAISRKAIVRHMNRDEAPGHDNAGHAPGDASDEQGSSAYGPLQIVQRALRAWWQHHPANIALDVARPVVAEYAREHPVRLLGAAAGIGAAAVLLKPWRLVSLGGVLLATMKSSDLSGIVLSMLSSSSHPQDPDSPRETP